MKRLPEIREAIKKYSPKDKLHFANGWQMWPEWWNKSTDSWKLGFLARQINIGKGGNNS